VAIFVLFVSAHTLAHPGMNNTDETRHTCPISSTEATDDTKLAEQNSYATVFLKFTICAK
jgi:hypothetical protein